MVNGVPQGSPAAKTLGDCGPSGFGLGTSLGPPFTTLPPRLFQIMSHFSGPADKGMKDIRDIPEGEIRALFNLIDKDKSGQLSASVSTGEYSRV